MSSRCRRVVVIAGVALALASARAAPPPIDCDDAPAWAPSALEQVNAARSDGRGCRGGAGPAAGIAPLRWNERLAGVARRQAGAMAAGRHMGHRDPDGQPLGARVASSGYAWRQAVENVAFGFGTLDALVGGWRASAGHCANLMNTTVVDVGLACQERDGVHYWSLVLGRPAAAD